MNTYKLPFLILFFICVNSSIAQTSDNSFAAEKKLFEANCTSCHGFTKAGIGPALGGLAGQVNEKWLAEFIKYPQKVIDRKDKRALAQYKQYKVVMPSFSYLSASQITGLAKYILSQKAGNGIKKSKLSPILDPIPAKIASSNLNLGLSYINTVPASGKEILRTRITKTDNHPVSGEKIILDLRGFLYQINQNEVTKYFDLAEKFPNFMQEPGFATGFGSFAFHPEFAKNGLLYTTHSEVAGSKVADYAYDDAIKVKLQWVITEWKTDNPASPTFEGKPREIFRINMVKQIHGMQEIAFNPYAKMGSDDYGLLHVGVGDGGCVEDGFPTITHDKTKPWGSVLRIDPLGNNSKNGQYGIPASNPFVKTGLGEVYANGFRNPHRISWTKNGQMIVSNIGQKMIESLNLVEKGKDYGWPVREGRFLQIPETDLSKVYKMPLEKLDITYPIVEIDHDEIVAICGGYEYLGENIPELKGKYIFGSVVEGRLFYINVADIRQNTRLKVTEIKIHENNSPIKLSKLTQNERVDLRLGIDKKTGEILVYTKPDGKVYQLIKN